MLKSFSRESHGPSRLAPEAGDDALIQSENADSFLATARSIVGSRHVLTRPGQTRRFKPLSREPHSGIGSSCLGASVLGGICNNLGGALVRRGPAFTQLALFAQVDADGQPQLVNHLGIRLDGSPEEVLGRLDRWAVEDGDIDDDPSRWASDRE